MHAKSQISLSAKADLPVEGPKISQEIVSTDHVCKTVSAKDRRLLSKVMHLATHTKSHPDTIQGRECLADSERHKQGEGRATSKFSMQILFGLAKHHGRGFYLSFI